MTDITEKTQGTAERGTGTRSVFGFFKVAPVFPRMALGVPRVLAKKQVPVLVLDEVAITPDSRSRQLQEQARTVIAKAGKGQHFEDGYLGRLSGELVKTSDPSNGALALRVGEVKVAQAKKDAARMITPVHRGVGISNEKGVGKPGPPAEPGAEFATSEAEWEAMVAGIAFGGRQAQARGVADRFARGERVSRGEVRRVAKTVEEALRQGGDWQKLAEFLLDYQGSTLQKAVQGAQDAERAGRPVAGDYVDDVQRSALGMERQTQLLGTDSRGGWDRARELGDIKRSRFNATAQDVLQRGQRGERFGKAYLQYLAIREVGIERQQELVGATDVSSDAALTRARALIKLPDVPLDQEARDVLGRAKDGKRFDKGYVDYLRQRLIGDESPSADKGRRRELAEALDELPRSWLLADVTSVIERAKRGEHVDEALIDSLQQRLVTMDSQRSREKTWSELARALDDIEQP